MIKYTGLDYLKIDIASQMGYDKESFEYRIQWVNDNEDNLEFLEDKADNYYRYAAAVKALRQYQAGIPTGHMVGLDACSSGPQILSVIVGCSVGAKNTGATGQIRADLYGILTKTMNDLLNGETSECTRKIIKSALMPFFYGSLAMPKEVFGVDTKELSVFNQSAEIVCPGAFMLLPIMLAMWDKTALEYNWDLPDGWQVKYLVKEKVNTKIEIDTLADHPTFVYRRTVNTTLESAAKIPANLVQSIDSFIVRELTSRCDYVAGHLRSAKIALKRVVEGTDLKVYSYHEKMWRKHKFLSLAGIEYDVLPAYSYKYAQAMIKFIDRVLAKPSFSVVSIFDEFKCHPNYMNYVRQEYINILAELADSRILDALLSDIVEKKIHIKKMSKNLSKLIRQSEYSLS